MIAILLGLFLGLVFTYGVYTANQTIKDKKTEQTEEVVQLTPSPSPLVDLVIDSPQDYSVVTKNQVTISGKTDPENMLVVYSESSEVFGKADQSGLFSVDFPLVKGSNTINIANVDSQFGQEETKLTIVYSDQI